MNDARLVFAVYVAAMCLVEVTPVVLNYGRRKHVVSQRTLKSRNSTRQVTFPIETSGSADALDFVQLVSRHGYPAEEHLVTTADGYRLRIHRIPGSPKRPKATGKPIVYFQHGLLASSDSWVLVGPEKDLAYMMADAGFDVWLGNVRGNTYARSHVTLRPDYDPEFWQYSFHEMGVFDVPATIDYILDQTGEQNLIYIGHSMGTTISYALLSTRPEYNDKIWLLISLAPVAFWKAPPRPIIKFLKTNTEAIKTVLYAARIYEIFPHTRANVRILKSLCSNKSPIRPLCLDMLWLVSGYNPDQLNKSLVPWVFSYFPAGTSRHTLEHYSQNIATGDFRMFDYGLTRNFAIYGQAEAPAYNLENIKTPVALYYGGGDALVSPGNPIELAKRLPNVVLLERVADDRFSHLDFILSNDIKPLLNEPIMAATMNFLKRRSL